MNENNWNKNKFRKYVYDQIVSGLFDAGFVGGDGLCKKSVGGNVLVIDPLYAAGKIPGQISISFECGIYVSEVSEILQSISVDEDASCAAFFFPIEAVGAQVQSSMPYVFAWSEMSDVHKKITKICDLIRSKGDVLSRLQGIDSLRAVNVAKLPFIGSVYRDGLRPDFIYCLPRVAALGSALDGKLSQAVDFVGLDGGLSLENRKSLIRFIKLRFESVSDL